MIPKRGRLSVCHAGGCAKTAERIEVLLGVNTLGRNVVLNGGKSDPLGKGRRIRCGLRQITLSTCLVQCNLQTRFLYVTISDVRLVGRGFESRPGSNLGQVIYTYVSPTRATGTDLTTGSPDGK